MLIWLIKPVLGDVINVNDVIFLKFEYFNKLFNKERVISEDWLMMKGIYIENSNIK